MTLSRMVIPYLRRHLFGALASTLCRASVPVQIRFLCRSRAFRGVEHESCNGVRFGAGDLLDSEVAGDLWIFAVLDHDGHV